MYLNIRSVTRFFTIKPRYHYIAFLSGSLWMYFSVCVYMLCKYIYECINKLKITCKIIYKYVFNDYDDDNDDDDEDDDYDDDDDETT